MLMKNSLQLLIRFEGKHDIPKEVLIRETNNNNWQ